MAPSPNNRGNGVGVGVPLSTKKKNRKTVKLSCIIAILLAPYILFIYFVHTKFDSSKKKNGDDEKSTTRLLRTGDTKPDQPSAVKVTVAKKETKELSMTGFCGLCKWKDQGFNCNERVEWLVREEGETEELAKKSNLPFCYNPNGCSTDNANDDDEDDDEEGDDDEDEGFLECKNPEEEESLPTVKGFCGMCKWKDQGFNCNERVERMVKQTEKNVEEAKKSELRYCFHANGCKGPTDDEGFMTCEEINIRNNKPSPKDEAPDKARKEISRASQTNEGVHQIADDKQEAQTHQKINKDTAATKKQDDSIRHPNKHERNVTLAQNQKKKDVGAQHYEHNDQNGKNTKENDKPKDGSIPLLSKNSKDELPHPLAHLNCSDHGGPTNQQVIDEMVFWSDIPSDSSYLSPMHPLNDPYTPDDTEKFLTFEPDLGGWNNRRMAMETTLVMSHAMGRTLVLPPEQNIYLIDGGVSFADFFHLDATAIEHRGFKVITMKEFLDRVGTAGELKDSKSNQTVYPPKSNADEKSVLWKYLRSVGNAPEWDPWECALAIPSSTDPESIEELKQTHRSIMDGTYGKPKPRLKEFKDNPTPVNASIAERMREMLADRKKLCIYDKPLQESKLIHLMATTDVRFLIHFYAFIFFADWKQDLWSKRFVRDHLRYVDEIMCAAARVVEAVRNHARKNNNHNASRDEGIYDATHIRRGDFQSQYERTFLPAEELYHLSRGELVEGATLYIATDEKKKSFFNIYKKHYDVVFLDDFLHVIPDVNTNYYGMIDQLVSYKSRSFYGTWWSTLSGYVNRMRGYYIAKHELEGYKDGTMKSWYFTPANFVLEMRSYRPVRQPFFIREFPIGWRDIDQGTDEIGKR